MKFQLPMIIIFLMYLTTITCHFQHIKDHFLGKIRKPRNYMFCEFPKILFYFPVNPPIITCMEPIIYYDQTPTFYNPKKSNSEPTGYDYPKPPIKNQLNTFIAFPEDVTSNKELPEYGPPIETTEIPDIPAKTEIEEIVPSTVQDNENNATTSINDIVSTIKEETSEITTVVAETEVSTINNEISTELEQTTIFKYPENVTEETSETTTMKPETTQVYTTESEVKTTTLLEEPVTTIASIPTESDTTKVEVENLETTTVNAGYMYVKLENAEIIQSMNETKASLIVLEPINESNSNNQGQNIRILYNAPPQSNDLQDIQSNYETKSNTGYFYETPNIPFEY